MEKLTKLCQAFFFWDSSSYRELLFSYTLLWEVITIFFFWDALLCWVNTVISDSRWVKPIIIMHSSES